MITEAKEKGVITYNDGSSYQIMVLISPIYTTPMMHYSWENETTLILATRDFWLLSFGFQLKINWEKSTLTGIGLASIEISRLAMMVGCKSGKLPFIYLGLPERSKLLPGGTKTSYEGDDAVDYPTRKMKKKKVTYKRIIAALKLMK